MLTMSAARRTAAVLTTALVAVLLVTFGGPSHGAGNRITVGSSHVGVVIKQARLPQAVAPSHQHDSLYVDLTTTLTSTTALVREHLRLTSPDPLDVRPGHYAVAATGRGPPAL